MRPSHKPTFGRLFREPHRLYLDWQYRALAARGFPDIRIAHSAVFRSIAPDGSRLTDLAALAGMTKQSMAYLVGQLVGFGYLTLSEDPGDGRARLVRLTERGRRFMAAAQDLSERYEAHVANLLGREDARQLRALLERLLTALESEPEPRRR